MNIIQILEIPGVFGGEIGETGPYFLPKVGPLLRVLKQRTPNASIISLQTFPALTRNRRVCSFPPTRAVSTQSHSPVASVENLPFPM